MNDIEKSLEVARRAGEMFCGECQESMFAPMDKLSISLFNKCSMHLEDDSVEQKNLLKISEAL